MKRAGRKESKQAKTRAEEEEEDEYDGWRPVKKLLFPLLARHFPTKIG